MGETQSASTFHVVCRECRAEELTASKSDARRVARDHAAAADHRVAFAPVDRLQGE